MNNTIDMMAQLLEKNNIHVSYGARKKDGSSDSKNNEKFHALVVVSSDPSIFIIDWRESRNMASIKDIFSSKHLNSGTVVRMGDNSEIHTIGVGNINLDNGYFNDVLYVPDLAENVLSIYQMTHTGASKRVNLLQIWYR